MDLESVHSDDDNSSPVTLDDLDDLDVSNDIINRHNLSRNGPSNDDVSDVQLPPLESLYNQTPTSYVDDTSTSSQPMPQSLPSAPSKTRKKKGKRHEEGEAQAFMAGDALHPKGRDVFILDTGCIGSHVFMENQHVSNMSNNTS